MIITIANINHDIINSKFVGCVDTLKNLEKTIVIAGPQAIVAIPTTAGSRYFRDTISPPQLQTTDKLISNIILKLEEIFL
ncbi:hypothetical protein VSA01S_37390 [Vibrio sagamiensis NBRC 104589]|uniref:Uncharacterized protein n=1 Tax=Vibrio sagamiensis NBRC 104589 TaxID=1219064 RepID=A0A511QKA8_9VIBR|nr:hypothetical protein VSA01S_37390 [Vibrio sagamiensis NBRC 104589]